MRRRTAEWLGAAAILVSCLTAATPSAAFLDGPPWEAVLATGCVPCHRGTAAILDSPALSLHGLPARIASGARYPLALRLTTPGMALSGFSIAALQGGDPTGRFVSTDERTATQGGLARSTKPGTRLNAAGRAEWRLDWVAPTPAVARLHFEVWANASDDDRSPLGDVIHQRAWEISPALGSDVSKAAEAESADARLLAALRAGGHNIYFRHAATDWPSADQVEAAGDWTSCDPNRMRQLSHPGRETARAVGAAIRAARIPVARVLASPYCRTMETAGLLDLGPVESTTDVMNTRVAEHFGGTHALVVRARRRLAASPRSGTNEIFVAHGNIVRAATGEYPAEAGAIVFRPGPDGALATVATLEPADWDRLARLGTARPSGREPRPRTPRPSRARGAAASRPRARGRG